MAGTTLFEVVYGHPPPSIAPFLLGEINVRMFAEVLRERDDILGSLRSHLSKAQQRMVWEMNKHR